MTEGKEEDTHGLPEAADCRLAGSPGTLIWGCGDSQPTWKRQKCNVRKNTCQQERKDEREDEKKAEKRGVQAYKWLILSPYQMKDQNKNR